jgi:hypothetical protein
MTVTVELYPDIPQLTMWVDGHEDEPLWWDLVDLVTVDPWRTVQDLETSHENDEGDKIVIECEEHDFVALAAFARMLHPKLVAA